MILITDSEINIAIDAIQDVLDEKNRKKKERRKDLSIVGDVMSFLTVQILIPIIVSLTSAALYDYLRGRSIASLGKKEIEEIANKLVGKKIDLDKDLAPECIGELRSILTPMGYSDKDIEIIFDKVVIELSKNI